MDVTGHTQHHLFCYLLDGTGQVHVALSQPRFRLSGRPAEELFEFFIRHRQPGTVIEIVHVQFERTVFLKVHQFIQYDVLINWLTVRGKPHNFVLPGVDLKSRVIGEGRIEQPERMGEMELGLNLNLIVPADTVACRRPLSHPVYCQKRSFLVRGGEESRCSVGLVVFGKDDLSRELEFLPYGLLHPYLLFDPQRHGFYE